jgi:transcriptional regulator MraZ
LSFRGTFDYSLDAKNRLTVPGAFRPSFADGLVVALHIDSCIGIWIPSVYDAWVDEALAGLPHLSPQRRELHRFFSANAFASELDSAGRVMIPPRLLDKASIEREVAVNGAGSHVEVWPRGAWSTYDADLAAKVVKLTESYSVDATG